MASDKPRYYDGAMDPTSYAIYPPPEPHSPWLAVIFRGRTPTGMFGCRDEKTAAEMLTKMRAAAAARGGIPDA